VYRVWAQIVEVPDPARPTSEFAVHHEAVPTFKNDKGVVVGMDSMEMPLPLAMGVSLKEFKPGDRVVITLAVGYTPGIWYEVTRLERLPPGTKLQFE
jgi:NADPH:quinone reductase-like Zn-dependent oxidoreductase